MDQQMMLRTGCTCQPSTLTTPSSPCTQPLGCRSPDDAPEDAPALEFQPHESNVPAWAATLPGRCVRLLADFQILKPG